MYGKAMFQYGDKDDSPFDERWLREGFCRPEDSDVEEMHLNSGLVMATISFPFIAFLYWKHLQSTSKCIEDVQEEEDHSDQKDDNEADLVKGGEYTQDEAQQYTTNAMIGVIGHAMGHFIILEALKNDVYPEGSMKPIDALRNDSLVMLLKKMTSGYFFFWIPLLKSYMQNTSWAMVFIFAAFVKCGALQIPAKFGFAYAQCCFFLSFSIDQLLSIPKEKKGLAFALYPLVTVVPSLIISWYEATACSTSTIMRLYGHVIYDGFMALSYIFFYVLCSLLENGKREKVKSA